ncbi:MAG TPA: hypothetical protein PK971_06460, partial [Saprospiraceae bacterium]|nr:hypothetical protein [Saprospiraceae bacterium]
WLTPVLLTLLVGTCLLLGSSGPYTSAASFNLSLNASATGSQGIISASADPLSDGQSPNTQRYLVYLFTGDGHFVLSEMLANQLTGQSTWGHTHTYASSGTYSGFVETADVYDDKDLPPAKSAPIVVNSSGTGTPPAMPDLGGYSAIITPVRKMVSGHALTYVITYGNTTKNGCLIQGEVLAHFDSTKLDWVGAEPYNGPGYVAIAAPTSPNTGTLHIPFSALSSGEKRNAFLNFSTKNGMAQQSVKPPSVEMAISSREGSCEGINTAPFVLLSHSVVETSHDPNHKSVTPAAFSKSENGYLDYMITFQNDGLAPVKRVEIQDYLDLPIRACDTSLIQFVERRPTSGTFSWNRKYGRIQAVFNNINMPGLAQTGYGTAFGESDTKGYLKFRIPMNCLSPKHDCSAICNRASIVFDCNPPIETNLAISRLTCGAEPPTPPTRHNPGYEDCREIDTSFTSTLTDTIGTTLLPSDFMNLDQGGYQFKWYPTIGLSNPLILNPTLTQVRNRSYTLVVSRACERIIVHRRVQANCHVKLSVNSINRLDCTPNYQVQMSATGANPLHLMWQDCKFGQSHSGNYAHGSHYFSVIDTSTGCYADTVLHLPTEVLQISDNPSDCVANPSVAGGTGPYTYTWTWQDAKGNPFSSTQAPPLPLKGKKQVKVVVKDVNGCSGSLSISKRWYCDCFTWPWIVVAGALLAAIALFIHRFRSR